jgi:predicted acyltransferase (DUF342 family)
MSPALAAIAFFLLTFGLAVLPFLPAIVEWRKRRDAEPLKVVRDSQIDIRYFANRFREFVKTNLGDTLETCRKSQLTERGTLENGTPYVVVGDGKTPLPGGSGLWRREYNPVILSCADLRLPESGVFTEEIFADGSVVGEERNVLRAVLAEEEIYLGRRSTSLRWLHAGRGVSAKTESIIYGRASAEQYIRIERGCRFERLNAPRIEFCYEAEAGELAGGMVYRESAVLKPRDLPNPVEVAAGRWLVRGNLDISAGKIVETDLVVTGSTHIGPGVRITGSVKSRKNMVLEKGVEVEGSLVSERDIHIGVDCRIRGPILAEGAVYVRKGTTIGSTQTPTTVSADTVFVEPGVVAHGTVWAHRYGRVASPKMVPVQDSNDGDTASR